MKLSRALIAWLLAAIAAIPTSAKDWRGIVPLVSTRADVERALGQPMKQSLPHLSFFDLKEETVRIVYSEGRCKPGIAGEWDVLPDTVLRIEVTPKKELYLKDIQMDVKQYKKIEHLHIAGRLTYVNEEEGISIDTDSIDPEHERVLSVEYGPRTKDEHIRCKSPKP